MEITFGGALLQGGDRTKCRVFLPCRPNKIDTREVKRFGATILRIWDKQTIFPDEEIELSIGDVVITNLQNANFDPSRDYVALVGDALISAIVCMALGRYYHYVVFLRWDTKMMGYWPARIR